MPARLGVPGVPRRTWYSPRFPAMEAKTRVRVRYAETDCMGRAYHANYLTWFECGRVEFLRAEGFDYARTEREDGCFLPVFQAEVKYTAPAVFDDELEITTRIVDYSFVRLTFGYEARRVRDGVLCAHELEVARRHEASDQFTTRGEAVLVDQEYGHRSHVEVGRVTKQNELHDGAYYHDRNDALVLIELQELFDDHPPQYVHAHPS